MDTCKYGPLWLPRSYGTRATSVQAGRGIRGYPQGTVHHLPEEETRAEAYARWAAERHQTQKTRSPTATPLRQPNPLPKPPFLDPQFARSFASQSVIRSSRTTRSGSMFKKTGPYQTRCVNAARGNDHSLTPSTTVTSQTHGTRGRYGLTARTSTLATSFP